MTDEHSDWANELDKISSKISEIASDLQDDKYGTNRTGIVKSLEKSRTDLDYVIGQLQK